ncbi:MAG: hypothetical protein QOH05_1903 [Acetobacteraceae bacterium]|nr:hypothetical protein [Acetobacteraceae bacterium]
MGRIIWMRRARFFAIVAWPLAFALIDPAAALAQRVPDDPGRGPAGQTDVMPEAAPPAPSGWSTVVGPETIVHAVGGFIGIAAFSFYVAPLSAASGVGAASVQSLLGTRVVATTLAATGAVLTTYIYDRWTDQPIDYTYFWSRAGAVVGVGAGTAVLATLGYPASASYARFSPPWVANRAFLISAGLLGAWMTDAWMRRDQSGKP